MELSNGLTEWDLRFLAHWDLKTIRYSKFAYRMFTLAGLKARADFEIISAVGENKYPWPELGNNDETIYSAELAPQWPYNEDMYDCDQVDFAQWNQWVEEGYDSRFGEDEWRTEVGPNADYTENFNVKYDKISRSFPLCVKWGAPYRKEVSIDNDLGSYQGGWIQVRNGVIVAINDWYKDAYFDGENGTFYPLKLGLDLKTIRGGDQQSLVDRFYHETGLQY